MEILPEDFYRMRFKDYILKKRGFYNKRLFEYRILRWAVAPLASIWSKDFNPYSHMSLTDDDKLKAMINSANRSRGANIDKRNLEALKKLKNNSIVYELIDGKIVAVDKSGEN